MTGTPAEWLILVLICVVVALIALAMHCEYKADESARITDDLANELEGLLFALSRTEIKRVYVVAAIAWRTMTPVITVVTPH